ncbi:DUF1492 domain-containing protein [Pelosinus sp. IPA-1]|uniref:DUF1492 domain-containing protein n=1 Tax=Pelosinus sp. IPA-1 TaxID=3029569 RepID=UPI002436179A|nr:DUF1492 domain-containing protein [Pelosinus sp. IPA-1]GMB00906.1 hypothetical protein PIPA1_37050 [Pelosinus sp. IPA-1]
MNKSNVMEPLMDKAEIIKLAVEAGTAAAIKHIEQEKNKEIKSRQSKRLYNTKLLLENYNVLKDHCENSISKLDDIKPTENAIDILDSLDSSEGSYIESIKRSTTRTYVIMAHIDVMMGMYRSYCESSNKLEDGRRYRVMRSKYIDDLKMTDICEQENIDRSTYFRDINEISKRLSGLIFGIDGLSVMRQR